MSESDSSLQPLTAAELLRRRQTNSDSKITQNESGKRENTADIDEEIRRLEAELQQDDSEDSSTSDDDSSNEEGEDPVTEKDKEDNISSGPAVLCLSTIKDDRIEPLPRTCLPSNKRRALKGIDETQDQKKPLKKQNVNQGLQAAIKEVLDGYVPRSAEKLPFYCRFCAKQFSNENEWEDHKVTDFHKTAVEVERKASYCKLCRKQLTSPAQLKEHVASRPHRERMQRVRSNIKHRSKGGHQNQPRLQWS